ncbi:MAG: TraG family conjugative transposon ATPase [Muribaculaceae bacterium]|nr:TraG family conjugative transposon ATPase [Muribaculaceae bacterium]
MSKSRKRTFPAVYSQIQEIDGYTVAFDLYGSPSVMFRIVNPVQKLCTDANQYAFYHDVLLNIVKTLGEGYALQKQDVFCRQAYHKEIPASAEFLTSSYFNYFNGREYTEITSYLIITQEPQKNQFVKHDPKKWDEFFVKVAKVADILADKHIPFRLLKKKAVMEYVKRFITLNFRRGAFPADNFKSSDDFLRTGNNRIIKSFPLIDIDSVTVPGVVQPFNSFNVNGQKIATDLLDFLPSVPHSDCVVFNQLIQVPAQRKLLSKLHTKSNRHGSMPGAANQLAKADIDRVLAILAEDSRLLVYCNYNIIVSCPIDKVTQVSSYIENRLFPLNITPSKTSFNQLELFTASFPGNGYTMNKDYDLFLTLCEAALCFFYKEHLKTDEITPLTTFYTDRQGLPVCIDITGKEGKYRYTDNANFFCIGPSGSGKSFHMNSVVRQLLEQGTDVVMVDTGDSYEGICSYFNGTYISYSTEHPISMNPFKITDIEYQTNFGEKKNFLKSLIFLLYKGDKSPSKVEDKIINQVIVEYYNSYFHPFSGFTEAEKESMKRTLLIEANSRREKNPEQMINDMVDIDNIIRKEPPKIENHALILPSEERKLKLWRTCHSLQSLIDDEAASQSEKETAVSKLRQLKSELFESSDAVKIEKRISLLEEQRKRLTVQELSFNSFYEYAVARVPQIIALEHISFNINEFASILRTFYKGGELEHILNSDMDVNLFDEKFIVFEIDKIKDDPVLFPIVVLIIMDVFLQKMRIKKGRKALIIEEAWKAIASPTMAEYIKYLYKTVRKFHGIAGVVTQELNDVIDSPIVKEAIINNSDIKILLDQTKFKDRYEDISKILGLTEVQKKQIFTINSLNNKEGRNFFKEVWICRGQYSDVYGVEEPPECYWAYTTERAEKEALKIYKAYFGNIQSAIIHIEKDRKKAGVEKYFDFATMINQHKKPMSLWEN